MPGSRDTLDERDAAAWLHHARAGDFASAWQASDRIRLRHAAAPDFTRPRHLQSIWTGRPLEGQRVLVRCYHGLGDTLQFIRFVPPLATVARQVSVWVQPPLIPLLESVQGIDRLLPLHEGAPEADYDVDVEVMELPYVFRTTLETIPADVPYLTVEPEARPDPRPRVGLVWRAGDWEQERSMPFQQLRPLLDLPGITWCSLQQGRRAGEEHPALHDISADSLQRVAERVAALDLLITVDSMPAHLGGALGIPVWTLLVHHADWRWMEARTDSPWYPSMRLFRQSSPGDWPGLIERVDAALAGFSARRPAGSARSG